MKRFRYNIFLLQIVLLLCPDAAWSSQQEHEISDHARLKNILNEASGHLRHIDLQDYVSCYPKDPEGYAYLGIDYIQNQEVYLLGIPVMVIGTIRQSEQSKERERLSHLSSAEECIRKFHELAPEETDRYHVLSSIVELYRYNHLKAISILKNAPGRLLKADNPLRDQAILILAGAYRETHDVKQSITYYQMLDLKKYPVVDCLIALTYFENNDLSNAIKHLKRSAFSDPDNVYREMLRAIQFDVRNDIEKALDHYQKAEMNGGSKLPYHFTVRRISERIEYLRGIEPGGTSTVIIQRNTGCSKPEMIDSRED